MMADDPEYEKGLQKAFRLLAARARSEKELRAKLQERKFDPSAIDRIIARLFELSYLDDKVFARQWARHLAVDKRAGNRRIQVSLQEKGVDQALREAVLAEIRQEFPEREAVRQIIGKKMKGKTLGRQDVREKRSLVQHLLGRGFTPALIYETMNEFAAGGISE